MYKYNLPCILLHYSMRMYTTVESFIHTFFRGLYFFEKTIKVKKEITIAWNVEGHTIAC